MKSKLAVVLILAAAALAVRLYLYHSSGRIATAEPQEPDPALSPALAEPSPPEPPKLEPVVRPPAPPGTDSPVRRPLAVPLPATPANKLERLAQIRESFRALAAGDPTAALRAAKLITDEIERETALFTLATEWTKGDLRPAQVRARAIADYGLEAGLGMELVKNHELALLWANELTDSSGRTALLGATAAAMVGAAPAAAMALSEQVPESDRRKFLNDVFAGWAAQDTEAALQWAGQVSDPAERDADLAAIRTAAPVGIGAALSIQDGYPMINQLLPGTPSEASGLLHPGDRIIALAQGDSSFLDTRGLSLQDIVQMVRGAPGTLLQLQVVSADGPLNSPPRTVPIIRSQLKFKN